MSLVQRLRADTAADHDRVDARYAGFDLRAPDDYARFLIAHARALPAVERALADDRSLPRWRERTSLIAADLAAMDLTMPEPADLVLSTPSERWGALYVIEGSRLGGQLLARGVGASLPSRYLGAQHLPGEWRALLQAIDAGPIEVDEAIAGARRVFALYLDTA